MKVHILATCRNPSLLPATLLVFGSVRTGFPSSDVVVYSNGNDGRVLSALRHKCLATGAELRLMDRVPHCKWIEALAATEKEPFWILDTDVVLWERVEHMDFTTAIAGRAMPEFYDLYTRCITPPRLHTCLLYVNPLLLNAELKTVRDSFVNDFGSNHLINPFQSFFCVSPSGVRTYYDTCAMLSYNVSRTDFGPEMNQSFDHLNCGTYADVVEPVYKGLMQTHRKVYKKPELLRGAWARQECFFKSLAQHKEAVTA